MRKEITITDRNDGTEYVVTVSTSNDASKLAGQQVPEGQKYVHVGFFAMVPDGMPDQAAIDRIQLMCLGFARAE